MHSSLRWTSALLPLTLAITGCSEFMIKFTVNSTGPVLKRGTSALDGESDVKLARDAIPAILKTLESFLAAHPTQADLLELVPMGYVQYAFGFLEDDLEQMPSDDSPARQELVERCTGLYDRGYDFSLRQIALDNKDVVKAAKSGSMDQLEQALKHVGKGSVPGLHWAGLALGSSINLHRDDVNRVAELPKAIAMLERSHKLDPTYFNHGAAMSLGVVYASQGKAVGGNPERAKQMFDEVITATQGRYLLAKVFYARYYATVTLDRPLFEKTLHEVLDAKRDIWPEQRLANELAKRRAARYLKQADDLF